MVGAGTSIYLIGTTSFESPAVGQPNLVDPRIMGVEAIQEDTAMNAQAIFEAVIDDCQPASVLVSGEAAEAAATRWQLSRPETTVDALESGGGELKGPSARPHDLALVSDTLETLSPGEGSLLLGQLRNLGNYQIAVSVSNTSGWSLKDFVALGFTRQSIDREYEGHTLYTYNIASYNHKRAWNNPKYWANPEMWNKARW